MRTLIAGAAMAALALGTVATTQPRDPVEHTYHLHGDYQAGEANWPATLDGVAVMNSTAPTEAAPKSRFATNYAVGPNPNCSANGLLAAWKGNVDGDVVGDLTIEVPAVSTGATVVVEVFADGGGGCNEAAVPPVLSEVVEVAPGAAPVAVTFSDVGFTAYNDISIQFRIIGDVHVTVEDEETGTTARRTLSKPNEQVRFLYDSTDYDGTVTFDCVPRVETDATCEWG